MTSTAYRLGADFERRVRDHLTGDGYTVIRSAGSYTIVDLVALKPGQVLLVQCRRSGRLDPHEWNRLHDVAVALGALPILADVDRRALRYRQLIARKDRDIHHPTAAPFYPDQVEADAR